MNKKNIYSIIMLVISIGIALYTWWYVESVYDNTDGDDITNESVTNE